MPRLASHGRQRSVSISDDLGDIAISEYHCNIYNSFISSIISSLEARFENDGFSTALKLEKVLLGNIQRQIYQ